MPIVLPAGLPALEELGPGRAVSADDARPAGAGLRARIALVNLMPTKVETEAQFARMLSAAPFEVHLDLVRVGSRRSSQDDAQHLATYYRTVDEALGQHYDGMIVTGAPVEHLPFEQVTYWAELCRLMDHAAAHTTSTLYVCWAAQAALYHFWDVPKVMLPRKLCGVLPHRVVSASPLVEGLGQVVAVPQSRHATTADRDIDTLTAVDVHIRCGAGGFHLATTPDHRTVLVSGHGEYDAGTLDREYRRDVGRGLAPAIPTDYYPDDDPRHVPINTWRTDSERLFTNWLTHCVIR